MASRSVSKRTAPGAPQLDALRRVPYFEELPSESLSAIAAVCSQRDVDAGAAIFVEGAPPSALFVLLAGRVRVIRASRHGREQVLHEEGPGATLGDVPVFDGEGYVGTALAVEPSTVLCIPRAALLDLIEAHPRVARRVIQILSRRVRRFALLAADLSLRDTAGRLAAHLLREVSAGGDGTIVTIPGTREQLAAELGTVREEVSRALSDLRARGIIDVQRRQIRILDIRRLRALT